MARLAASVGHETQFRSLPGLRSDSFEASGKVDTDFHRVPFNSKK